MTKSPQMAPEELSAAVHKRASKLGFVIQGVCPAVAPTGLRRFEEWLARGYSGDMNYLSDHQAAYAHPKHVLAEARSVVMLALPYSSAAPAPAGHGFGRVSRYAWGEVDYHDLIRKRLHKLADHLRELVPAAATRCVVDTAPLMEREFAQLAGLGWIGKHTLLLNRQHGSYFFLAALLTDVELAADAPHMVDHCGSCTACLDACPTDAFPQPYVLDATRCISYLTIEHRGSIPSDLRAGIGDWTFGCDVCQDVCPWNGRSAVEPIAELQPVESLNPIDCRELFKLTEKDFRRRFRHTPLWRAHRRGLLRNAAVVFGNQRDRGSVSVLAIGLGDKEPLVRSACAWALGQIRTFETAKHLRERMLVESDEEVLQEIRSAL